MTRALGLLVVAALAAAFPAAARADRSYGAVGSGGGDLVTLRLSDSGRSLRALTLRVELRCAQGGVAPYVGTLRVVDVPPARSAIAASRSAGGPAAGRSWPGSAPATAASAPTSTTRAACASTGSARARRGCG